MTKMFRLFAICLLMVSAVQAQMINRAEYFIDVDPGQGNATSLTISTPAAAVNLSFSIPTTSLSSGFHVLGLRTRESVTSRWSLAAYSSFYIVPALSSTPASTIIKAEYFYDVDPGDGNGTTVSFTTSAAPTFALTLPTTALASGFHTLHFRVRDNLARWSIAHIQTFYIVPPVTPPGSTNLVKAEYFFDTDPGHGNGTALSISSGATQTNSFIIPLTGLTEGFHRLNVRYRDTATPAKWSHASQHIFYITNLSATIATKIERIEYFIDTDPGYGSAKPASFTQGATIDQLLAINLTSVASGNHVLYMRAKDDKGYWSDIVSATFSISNCTPPAQPVVADQSRCKAGTVSFTASGATGEQVYRWYDDPVSGSIISTGAVYTTGTLSASKVYYSSIYDPTTSCESARKEVTANVTVFPKPAINPSGSISFCEGSSVFASAPTGFVNYEWSNGQTTQQILVTTAGDYTVQVGNGTCLSEVSDVTAITVIPSPAKPAITVTGNTTICGTGSVDLSGPDDFEYVWSNSATTKNITVSQTGVFFLIVKTAGASCPSLPSVPVVVAVLTPPCGMGSNNQSPIIDAKAFASQIEGTVQVDLTQIISDNENNLDFSTLRVVNGVTSRGVAAFIDGAYILQIDYAGNPFTGNDRITLEVCDLIGACTQQVIDIDVVGEVIVYNGITPDGNGINDFMEIKYIDVVDGASKNTVKIFNRWGDTVFDVEDYDNVSKVFYGQSTSGNDLPSGTYFYKIDFQEGKSITGFIMLKR